jgi:hypothetical protein
VAEARKTALGFRVGEMLDTFCLDCNLKANIDALGKRRSMSTEAKVSGSGLPNQAMHNHHHLLDCATKAPWLFNL